MLNDMPQFRKDVSTTLAGLRSLPDGSFQANWMTSAPKLDDGGNNANWYYALHHFDYRLVGHKNGDKIDYRVEIQKRYDWACRASTSKARAVQRPDNDHISRGVRC
jgi:hypothetical protein